MVSRSDLADLMFPNVKPISYWTNLYPPRPTGQIVTRLGPSPTGYMHIGQLFMVLVNEAIATQSNGVFFLRIEDTDSKREVEGAKEFLITSLKHFGIKISEGPIGPNGEDVGAYGPYTQSQRKDIYHSYIAHLMRQGLAYPCWMTPEELDQIRDQQMLAKKAPGIYGTYSFRRSKTPQECLDQRKKHPDCVIRFRNSISPGTKTQFEDANRGLLSMADNCLDHVIMKSNDKLPTYHLAHVVDDHLMGTTHVIRGEEWLVSVPWHRQLFAAFGREPPIYCHTPLILKLDNGKKRKMSKRSDPECSVHYLLEQGYTVEGIKHYLTALINSDYEDWFVAQQENNTTEPFRIRLEAMNSSGSLFDITKLGWWNNQVLTSLSHDAFWEGLLAWTQQYDPDFFALLMANPDHAKKIINCERLTPNDPKKYNTWADVKANIGCGFDEIYDAMPMPQFPLDKDMVKDFLIHYRTTFSLDGDAMARFGRLQEMGDMLGYARTNAQFKDGGYKGKIGDLAMILRIVLCKSTKTPDLYAFQTVIGNKKIIQRLDHAIATLS
ncbi:MAG: glutamate--tRNA ligase family protein [Candidatus Absconditabacterales bacterium]|nr:glutamate--tRNA ligase family protein [Candidatus Absconditabacterales bacterium]